MSNITSSKKKLGAAFLSKKTKTEDKDQKKRPREERLSDTISNVFEAIAPRKKSKPAAEEVTPYSSIPSTPTTLDSSELSFTSSDISDSDRDPDSSSVDEFAQNKLEIKLDEPTNKQLKNKIEKVKSTQSSSSSSFAAPRGVICLSHIPFGFYEEQMKSFFTQFGTVTRLRLSRAKRSARSRGYAFIEFDDADVATIVAETMNNYLMYGRRLKCELIPPSRIHPDTFKGSARVRQSREKSGHDAHRLNHNRFKTVDQMEASMKKLVKKEDKRREKLAAAGIEYEFEGYAAIVPMEVVESSKPATTNSAKSSKKSK